MKLSLKLINYTIITFIIIVAFGINYYVSTINYLIPHTFLELLGAAVAMTIFVIGWNTREYSKNNFMIVLATGYVLVAILTVFHTISYKGMGVFSGNGANLPTQFWIATRYVGSITMLTATYYSNKKKAVNSRHLLGLSSFIGIAVIISIFTGIFPDCFIEDVGLTQFKIISEYIICSIFVFTAYLLWRQKPHFQADVFRLVITSILLAILSEFSFTLYTNPHGLINLIGHFIMAISVLLVYFSLVLESLKRPYRTLFHNVAEYADELVEKNKELIIKDKAMSTSLNAIVLTDMDGIITYVNQSFLNLLGYETEQEVLGQSATEFVDHLEDIKLTDGNWYGELSVKNKNNREICGLATINLIYSEHEKPICAMASFMDITIRKEIENELKRAKKEAEAANQAKSIFLANMSHEIRTPMNGIVGFLQLLENTPTSKEQLEYINNIKISTDALLSVINDILDVSKIEAGKMELEHISFDLRQAIENAVIPFTVKASQKGLELNMLVKPDVPQYVIGDPTRLRQVISNLISNGIKFTQNGYVLLQVENKAKKGNQIDLQFTVEDSGIGMSQDAIQKIFKPFCQADESSQRKYGGTGLGLTICESIVKLMNGSIHVESEEGKGTKFTFTISVKEETNNLAKPNKSNELFVCPSEVLHDAKYDDKSEATIITDHKDIEVSYNRLNVLLAEDNEINRCFFIKILKMKGIECDIAINGEDAVKACLSKSYDLVFMDCQMPVMDGYEATRSIRKEEGSKKHTFIIAMTAYALNGDAEKCTNAGMDDYLPKPIDNNKLTAIINKYTQKSVENKECDHFQASVQKLMKETGFDRATAEELLKEGMVNIKELIHKSQTYIQNASYDDALAILHQLKGVAGNLQLKEIVEDVIDASSVLKSDSPETANRILMDMQKFIS